MRIAKEMNLQLELQGLEKMNQSNFNSRAASKYPTDLDLLANADVIQQLHSLWHPLSNQHSSSTLSNQAELKFLNQTQVFSDHLLSTRLVNNSFWPDSRLNWVLSIYLFIHLEQSKPNSSGEPVTGPQYVHEYNDSLKKQVVRPHCWGL